MPLRSQTGRAMDYLFDGIEIDCTSENFAAKATCSMFHSGEAKAVQPTDKENIFKFSVFGAVSVHTFISVGFMVRILNYFFF